MGFHRKRINIPIYDSLYLDIIVSDSSEEISKELGDNEERTYYAMVSKTSFRNEDGRWCKSITVVLCTEDEKEPITDKVMVHEAVHVKNIIFNVIGQKNSTGYGEDETEAYLVEWLFGQIKSFFEESCQWEADNKEEEGKVAIEELKVTAGIMPVEEKVEKFDLLDLPHEDEIRTGALSRSKKQQ